MTWKHNIDYNNPVLTTETKNVLFIQSKCLDSFIITNGLTSVRAVHMRNHSLPIIRDALYPRLPLGGATIFAAI